MVTKRGRSIYERQTLRLLKRAALSVKGVSRMRGNLMDGIMPIKGFMVSDHGIKITGDENEPVIDLYVNVNYKVNIPETAWKIQARIGKVLSENGMNPAKKINIHVQGVDAPEEYTTEYKIEKADWI